MPAAGEGRLENYMVNKSKFPIGVFDSGLGGLTVMKELMRLLPGEDMVYYGDTARVPYGTKSKESIVRFSVENARVLLKYKVKLIVVACNSSSSFALKALKKRFRVPVVGVIRPGAIKAAAVTRNRKIGVIATTATIASGAYVRALKLYAPGARVFPRACPLFVPLAEEGWFKKRVVADIAREYMRPLKKAGIDTLILGCTHYPLLSGVIQMSVGKGTVLVDSAREVACEVKRLLARERLARAGRRAARHKFLVSDRPQEFQKIARNFLGRNITSVIKV